MHAGSVDNGTARQTSLGPRPNDRAAARTGNEFVMVDHSNGAAFDPARLGAHDVLAVPDGRVAGLAGIGRGAALAEPIMAVGLQHEHAHDFMPARAHDRLPASDLGGLDAARCLGLAGLWGQCRHVGAGRGGFVGARPR